MHGLRLATQRTMAAVAARLRSGATDEWFTAIGTSMRPAVRVVQRVRLRPPAVAQPLSGHVVLVRVADRWGLHRVAAEETRAC